MSFGKRVAEIRKERNLSQAELAELIGSKAPVVGRYERGSSTPSVKIATKIARALNITLDYLVGNTDVDFEQDLLKRMQHIHNMPTEEKEKIFMVIDALIRDYKVRDL